jgi:phage terminase Nu1 subunit (DNA packaging protein)
MKKKSPKSKHCTTAEIMKLFGVSDRTLTNWKEKGCPQVAHGKWSGPDVIKWYIGYISGSTGDDDMETPNLQESKARLVAAKARLTEHELEKEQGLWISREEHKNISMNTAVIMRTAFLNAGTKLAPNLAGERDHRKIKRLIDAENEEILSSLAKLGDEISGTPEDINLPVGPEVITWWQSRKEVVDAFNAELERNIKEYERLMAEQGRPIVPLECRKLLMGKPPEARQE